MDAHNFSLTGLPRSGTSLACKLLCSLSNVIALDEPFWPQAFPVPGLAEAYPAALNDLFAWMRQSLLEKRQAFSRHIGGQLTDNHFSASLQHAPPRVFLEDTPTGRRMLVMRQEIAQRSEVHFDKPLTPDFDLIIKGCTILTGLLVFEEMRSRMFALVRNPLAVFASWNSANIQLHPRLHERYAPDLAQALEAIPERLERQFYLLDWFFTCYDRWLPAEKIIRYEDVVRSRGKALAAVHPSAAGLDVALENQNTNRFYHRALMREAGARLLSSGGKWQQFYDRADIQRLLEQIER